MTLPSDIDLDRLLNDERLGAAIRNARAKGVPDEKIQRAFVETGALRLDKPYAGVAKDSDKSLISSIAEVPELAGLGFEQSVTAILSGKGPDAKRLREIALNDYNWFQKAIIGTSAVISDLPVFFAGEVAGTAATGSPVAATGFTFAMMGGIRETWNAYNEFKEENPKADFTIGEFIANLDTIAAETGREAIVGLSVGGVGKFMQGLLRKEVFQGIFNVKTKDALGAEFKALTRLGKGAEAAAEVGALTTSSAAVRGELPTVDSLIENALVIGGLKITRKLASSVLKLAKRTGTKPEEILSGLDQRQIDKLEARGDLSERIGGIVEERVTERKAGEKQAIKETKEITAKERIRRGVEITKEMKQRVKQLEVSEQKSIERIQIEAKERAKKLNEKTKEQFEKLVPKETEGRQEIQEKLMANQIKDAEIAVEAKIKLSERLKKITESTAKKIEKLKQESAKQVSRLNEAANKQDRAVETEAAKKSKAKLAKDRTEHKNNLEKAKLKGQIRLEKARTENQKKAIRRQIEQTKERLQEQFEEKVDAHEKRVKNLDKNPDILKKKKDINDKLFNKIEKEQRELQKRIGEAGTLEQSEKKAMSDKLSKELKDRQKATTERFVKEVSKFDKSIQKAVSSLEKTQEKELQRIEKKEKKSTEKTKQQFEKQKDREKQKALKRWQNVKETVPSDFQAIEKDGNRVKVIKEKRLNRQDYALEGNEMDMRRPTDDNSRTIIDNQHTIEEIAASNIDTPEGNRDFLQKVDNAFKNNALGKMFVDVPFNSINAKETGFAIKNLHTKQLSIQDRFLKRISDIIKPKDFSEQELRELIILSERPKVSKKDRARFGEAQAEIRSIFDGLGKQLQAQGAFEKLFPFSLISHNEVMIEQNKMRLKGTTNKAEAAKISGDIARMTADNKALKDIRFVSIPAALIWADQYSKNPMEGSRALKSLTAAKRKSFSMIDLLESGAMKESDINFDDIMATYIKKASRDIAIFDIIDAAKKDGLVAKTDRSGTFVELSPIKYPLLGKQYAHPAFAEFLGNYTHTEPQGFVSRMLAMAKGFAFFNPMVLPVYDLYQGAMLGAISPLHPIKTGRNFLKALKSMRTQDAFYQEADANGLFPSPFDRTFDDLKANVVKSRTFFGNGVKAPFVEFLSDFLSPENMKTVGVKALYDTSQKIAWLGDRYVRMTSYFHLLEQGLTPRDAAQVGALFHADYAAVNPKLRKSLNKIFFTPTFKLAMGRLYGNMLTEAVRLPFVKRSQSAYENKISKIKAMGLVNTAAILFGTNMLMESLGFKTQQFGRKYFMDVDTEDGKKELTTVFSNPPNIALKFFYRAKEALDPLNTNSLESFYNLVQWEVHPVWRTMLQIRDNRSFIGDPIYNELGDTGIVKAAKSIKYSINQLLPAVTKAEGVFEPEQKKVKSTQKANVVLARDFGKLSEMAFEFFGFNYLRQPEVQRDAFRIKQLVRLLKTEMRAGRMTKAQLQRANERITSIIRKHKKPKQAP